MSRVKHHRISLLALAATGLGAFLVHSTPASAESAQVLRLAYGTGGPQEKQGGAGNEQPTSVVLNKNGKVYVVTVFMSSNIPKEDRPWQCKCSSVEMSPTDGPVIVADQVQLTDYDGDRPCNHPMAATDGQHVVWTYGSDRNNQANVSTYAGVLNEMCQVEYDAIRISNNNNNNEGAPDISFNGNGYFTAGYLSTGGNDISYARGLILHTDGGEVTLEKTYLKGVVTPANIGRPSIVAAGADRSLFCAAKGDNRPPEDGVECAWLDAMTGDIMWKQIVAASQPNQKIYMNQPSISKLDFGRFAVNVQESSGAGKNDNIKGANVSHLFILEPHDGGYFEKAHQKGTGTYQTHAAICGGAYGMSGERTVAIMGAPITGVGLPGLQMATYQSVTGLKIDKANEWPIGFYGDSGKLANLYGQNPNTQGRDFLRCIGDVPNPGHGVEKGFMSNVETFFVAPHAGRVPGDPKNALYISFVPGKTDKPVEPEPPKEVESPTPPDPTTSASSTGGDPATSSAAAGGGSDNNNDPDEPTGSFGSSQPGACACTTPGTSSSRGDLGALAALGLALLAGSRRKSS